MKRIVYILIYILGITSLLFSGALEVYAKSCDDLGSPKARGACRRASEEAGEPPKALTTDQASTTITTYTYDDNGMLIVGQTNTVNVGETGYTSITGGQLSISGYYRSDVTGLWYGIGNFISGRGGGGGGGNNCTGSGCGPTTPPIPVGIVQARARTVDTVPQTCEELEASTNWRKDTVLKLMRGSTQLASGKQASTSAYLTWSVPLGTYRVLPAASGNQSIRVCRTTNGSVKTFGAYSGTITNGSTVAFDVAYGPLGPWFQADGGDVYAGDSISSLIPSLASPRQFMTSQGPTGNKYPGFVIYGDTGVGAYDFNESSESYGETLVSSKDWLVNYQYASQDLYGYFYTKLGSPQTADYTSLTSPLDMPATRVKPYYVSGDMTTNGDWSVPTGEKLILVVDGDVTVNGQMHTTGTGMLIIVANGDITFAPEVGVAATSTTPSVEGIYIAGGTLHTGESTVAGKEKFVGKGIFIANGVSFERNLSAISMNDTNAASLFIYNPSYLVHLPDEMKDSAITWQEVAP